MRLSITILSIFTIAWVVVIHRQLSPITFVAPFLFHGLTHEIFDDKIYLF